MNNPLLYSGILLYLTDLVLISEKELQQLFRVGRTTTYKWRRKKIFPHLEIGNRIYYRLTDIVKIIRNRTGK